MAQTRTLILVRHAKSAWGLDLDDRERPLSKRGRQDAAALGEFLATRKLAADLLLCSPAVRAAQTWEHASAAGARAAERLDDERIYEAMVDELLRVLRQLPDQTRTVIMIGHSPAIPDLVETLAVRQDHAGQRLREAWRQMDTKYPTSGCAVINYDGDWAGLKPGSAELESFDVPRPGKPIPPPPKPTSSKQMAKQRAKQEAEDKVRAKAKDKAREKEKAKKKAKNGKKGK